MNTEHLIAELALQSKPVKRVGYGRVCAEALAVSMASLVLVCGWHGLRADIFVRLHEPIFVLELGLNIALVALAACLAVAFAYPDRARAPRLLPALVVLFACYSALIFSIAMSQPSALASAAENTPHGIECLLCILMYAAAPAMWMLWRLRTLASTRPMLMGGAAVMMAVAAGCLGVRLIETETASAGLMLWHYAPLLVLSGVGLVMGKKIFCW